MANHYTTEPQLVNSVCDTRELETVMSCLGGIIEVPKLAPRYDKCHTSIVATGKEGRAPGQLNIPICVAIHEDTHQIFIVNQHNHRVEILSETGEFLYQLGVGQLLNPVRIAIHRDSVYVNCYDHTMSKFSINEMCRVWKKGGRGSNNRLFNNLLLHLTADSNGCVYTVDYSNHRICIHDPNLNHLRNITLQFLSRPRDLKVACDRLYVLCSRCIHVLTLEGDKLHSLAIGGEGISMLLPLFFCLDPLNNLVTGDYGSHSIRVFSPEGNLLHTIGRKAHQQGMFYQLTGVAITPNGRLICVSLNKNCGLQIKKALVTGGN